MTPVLIELDGAKGVELNPLSSDHFVQKSIAGIHQFCIYIRLTLYQAK